MDNISIFSFHKMKGERYFCDKSAAAATTIYLPWTSMVYTASERDHYTITN